MANSNSIFPSLNPKFIPANIDQLKIDMQEFNSFFKVYQIEDTHSIELNEGGASFNEKWLALVHCMRTHINHYIIDGDTCRTIFMNVDAVEWFNDNIDKILKK